MARIRVKHFGPIKEGYLEDDGWIDINKVTVFIGNQGSGKSTIAKLISTLTWIEKALSRGDITREEVHGSSIIKYLEYQKIDNYFYSESYIEYYGEVLDVTIKGKGLSSIIAFRDSLSVLPKIMYVPAERNFLSVIQNVYNVTNLPNTLKTFGEEFRKSLLEIHGDKIKLPIGDATITYDIRSDKVYLKGVNYYLDLAESSSGFHSLVPLYAVTTFLINQLKNKFDQFENKLSINQTIRLQKEKKIIEDRVFNDEVKSIELNKLKYKFIPSCLINIVEEPEQNLFPQSQKEVLFSLLKANNEIDANKLIITTHSPYILSYLNIAMQANYLLNKIVLRNKLSDFESKLNKIIPLESLTKAQDVSVYEMDEITGTISKLKTTEGILSDDNYLNQSIRHSNEMFDALLEIEEEL